LTAAAGAPTIEEGWARLGFVSSMPPLCASKAGKVC
jgi:hypothetical protein